MIFLHGANEHAHPVPQKARVGRIVDVGLCHRGIHAHPPAFHNSLILRDLHHPLVDPLDHLRAHRQAPPPHGLGIRHLAAADPSEVAVDQIGTYFALENLVAPVADMLENEQPQHHLGRRTMPPAAAALRVPLAQCLIHSRNNDLVVQDLVGMDHPGLTQAGHFLSDPVIRKLQLRPPHLNHAASSRGAAWWGRGAANRD